MKNKFSLADMVKLLFPECEGIIFRRYLIIGKAVYRIGKALCGDIVVLHL